MAQRTSSLMESGFLAPAPIQDMSEASAIDKDETCAGGVVVCDATINHDRIQPDGQWKLHSILMGQTQLTRQPGWFDDTKQRTVEVTQSSGNGSGGRF